MLEGIISELTESRINKLITDTADFAVTNGVVMLAAKHLPLKRYRNIPITLFPSPIPKEEYQKIVRIQPMINKLMHLISQDSKFMCSVMESVAEVDDFIKRFLDIYRKHLVYCDDHQSDVLTLGIFRSDYMFGREVDELGTVTERAMQTEINTVSSGMGSIGSKKIDEMYNTMLKESPTSSLLERIPANVGNPEIGRGLALAWREYGSEKAVIVFFVMENETNISDHRTLEFNIYAINPQIIVRRKIYDQILDKVRTGEDGRLFVEDEEVAVAYFRTCYAPRHFPSEQHWDVREKIELSRAIKSPSIAHHIVGSKKIQEVLGRPGILEKYLDGDLVAATDIRTCFAGVYSLEMNEEGDRMVHKAIENPDKYVLKPQREGGGNNLYGAELRMKLIQMRKTEERCGYILMDKIVASSYPNYMIMDCVGKKDLVISELGIFGVCLTRGNTLIENYASGHLHRVKSSEVDEGGIMSGTGAVTSPLLI